MASLAVNDFHECTKRAPGERRRHDVHVVGHHAPSVQTIAFAIEAPKRIGPQASDVPIRQETGAVTAVEGCFDASSTVRVALVLRHAFELGGQLGAERRWEAALQAKGDALDDLAPFEAGQVAAAVPWRGCLARTDRLRARCPRSQDDSGSGVG